MQRNYLSFDQGDIVVIELPFSDMESVKRRPVLIVSKKEINEKLNDVVVVKITGSKYEKAVQVGIENKDLEEGKLKKKSYVELSFVFTVEKRLIKKKIAKIKKSKMREILRELKNVF